MTRRKSGFTLVELLVVITIIGLLIAISLPALATVRERARQSACANNLRELAKAVLSYELAKEKFPSSFSLVYYDADNPADGIKESSFTWTWVPQILPQLDEQAYYDDLFENADPQLGASPLLGVDNPRYLRSFPILVCPTDTTVVRGTSDMSYAANMGGQDDLSILLPLNYDNAANGVFHNRVPTTDSNGAIIGRGAEIGKDDIKDGTAYTLLITENVNAAQWWRWWESGTADNATFDNMAERYTGVVWTPGRPQNQNTPPDDVGVNQDLDPPVSPVQMVHARPSSRHQGGFNASFVDGSVKFISEEITYLTYRRLMAIDDSATSYTYPGPTNPLNQPVPFDPADLEK